MAIGDGFPPRIDDRDGPKDAPLIGRIVDVAVLQVGLAEGVDGDAPAVEQIGHALVVAGRERGLKTHSSLCYYATTELLGNVTTA